MGDVFLLSKRCVKNTLVMGQGGAAQTEGAEGKQGQQTLATENLQKLKTLSEQY